MRPLALEDLGHELRLLIGADEIVKLIEAHTYDFGNIVNYFKDSIYLHARNLLNALTNQYETEIGAVPAGIRSETYGQVKRPLERYVYHLNQARDQTDCQNITADGRHLNEYPHPLTDAAKQCWSKWIELTENPEHKKRLENWLTDATTQAQDDRIQLQHLLKGSK
jgi:hypothetical protein